METSPQRLQEFLFDFDNSDINDSAYLNRENLNRELIFKESYWENLSLHFREDSLNSFFETLTGEQRESYFRFGIECMLNFIQANFTGPELGSDVVKFLKEKCADCFGRSHLSMGDEEVNINTKYCALLSASLTIFRCCDYDRLLNSWWLWRALIIHQLILDDLSPNLLAEFDRLYSDLQNLCLEPHFRTLLELEQAQCFQIYRDVTRSERHLEKAREMLGIGHEMLGALGKRTRYQANDVAQLQLAVTVKGARCEIRQFGGPKNLALEDDVRLDTVQFSSEQEQPLLTDLEQKYLILFVKHMMISQPHDNLYYEEIKPYFDYLLSQRNTWAVRAVVLLMRCKLESTHKRTIERCLLQCEEIVQCVGREAPPFFNRVTGIFTTHFPPLWKIEEQWAELMLNLGLIKASLDIYLKLQLWEEVIVCYTLLNMRHKAAEIIKERLETSPTVKLWCLLGDATDDVSCYETAWELSRHRSSRAQRHWAEHFYSRKQYANAIPHFEESLKINPLQLEPWLRYAFAALETENWQSAATAYKRYTALEPGNFQAWNNLAKAYVKLGQKRAAHQALHDAIKCDFDNWKVWDNLMVVSVDVGAFSDVVNAYHRILDLKGKHVDAEVLQALVSNSNSPEKRMRELFGRLSSVCPLEGVIWELYAELAPDTITAVQRLQRAHRGYTQTGWEKDMGKSIKVLQICSKLANRVLSNDIEASNVLVSNVRLSLKASLSAIQRQRFNEPLSVDELSLLLQQVTEKCKSVVPVT